MLQWRNKIQNHKPAVGNVNAKCGALYRSSKPLPPDDAPNKHVCFAGLEVGHQVCQLLELTSKLTSVLLVMSDSEVNRDTYTVKKKKTE